MLRRGFTPSSPVRKVSHGIGDTFFLSGMARTLPAQCAHGTCCLKLLTRVGESIVSYDGVWPLKKLDYSSFF